MNTIPLRGWDCFHPSIELTSYVALAGGFAFWFWFLLPNPCIPSQSVTITTTAGHESCTSPN
ncbi:hypothetical protein [Moorena producens]|uniref:hypothetical protein n=1 Tax=Moorena producens TaxID=1155739 RepID=UPI0011EA6A2B|nr:hypothetical protein [Moorena producens]